MVNLLISSIVDAINVRRVLCIIVVMHNIIPDPPILVIVYTNNNKLTITIGIGMVIVSFPNPKLT